MQMPCTFSKKRILLKHVHYDKVLSVHTTEHSTRTIHDAKTSENGETTPPLPDIISTRMIVYAN